MSDVEGAFAGGAVLVAQVHYVDMHEADLVVLEGAVRFPGLLGGRHSVEALRPEDALDGVPAQVRQEGVDDEGQCIEGEAGGAAERAHDGTLLIAGPLEPLMRPGRAILTGIGAALAPFADGLHEDAVALGQHPGDFGRADDLGADNGVVRAWGWMASITESSRQHGGAHRRTAKRRLRSPNGPPQRRSATIQLPLKHVAVRVLMNHSAFKVVVAGLLLLAGGASSGQSQTQTDLCADRAGPQPPDRRIDACTALIVSEGWSSEALAPTYNNRGVAWKAQGNLDRALADFDRAIQLSPNYATAYFNRGVAWDAKGDLDHALTDYDRAIQINPKYAAAYNNRGNVWDVKGNLEKALTDYDKAIQIDSNYATAYNNRCWVRAIAGQDLLQALADCNAALQIDPRDAASLDSRGLVHLKLAAYDEAVADYTAILIIQPNSASAFYGRGIARQRKGDKGGGEADMTRAKTIQADIAHSFASYSVQ